MEDANIIALYWARSEEAIARSDTWLGAWNAMPPQRPKSLPPFLGRIARNTALDRYDYNRAQCRDSGFEAVLEELAECVGGASTEEALDLRQLGEAISAYLAEVSPAVRTVFLRRYWYCDSVAEIAERTGYSQSKIKAILHRARKGSGGVPGADCERMRGGKLDGKRNRMALYYRQL